MKLFYNWRIFKYYFLYLIILLLVLFTMDIFSKSVNYSYAASISSNKIEKIPKTVKNKIKKILGDVKYLSIKIDKAKNLIIIVQKNMIKYEVVVDKNKKILKILSIVKDETPEMGC